MIHKHYLLFFCFILLAVKPVLGVVDQLSIENCENTGLSQEACAALENMDIEEEDEKEMIAEVLYGELGLRVDDFVYHWNSQRPFSEVPYDVNSQNILSIRDAWVRDISAMTSAEIEGVIYVDSSFSNQCAFGYVLELPDAIGSDPYDEICTRRVSNPCRIEHVSMNDFSEVSMSHNGLLIGSSEINLDGSIDSDSALFPDINQYIQNISLVDVGLNQLSCDLNINNAIGQVYYRWDREDCCEEDCYVSDSGSLICHCVKYTYACEPSYSSQRVDRLELSHSITRNTFSAGNNNLSVIYNNVTGYGFLFIDTYNIQSYNVSFQNGFISRNLLKRSWIPSYAPYDVLSTQYNYSLQTIRSDISIISVNHSGSLDLVNFRLQGEDVDFCSAKLTSVFGDQRDVPCQVQIVLPSVLEIESDPYTYANGDNISVSLILSQGGINISGLVNVTYCDESFLVNIPEDQNVNLTAVEGCNSIKASYLSPIGLSDAETYKFVFVGAERFHFYIVFGKTLIALLIALLVVYVGYKKAFGSLFDELFGGRKN